MPTITTLQTARLILRPFNFEDEPAIRECMKDREIAHNILSIPCPYPDDEALRWILQTHGLSAQDEGYYFAISLKNNGEFIGEIDLECKAKHKRAGIRYWIGEQYRGNHYAEEAVRRVLQFGFETLELNRIQAGYFTHNKASLKLLLKVGMKKEGVYRQYFINENNYFDDKYFNLGMCSILRCEWFLSKPDTETK